jgi:hypothetical protein
LWYFLVKIAVRSEVLFGHLRRALFNRDRLAVVGVRRAEGFLSATTSQSLVVVKRPQKAKGLLAASERSRAEAALQVKSTIRLAMIPPSFL